MSEFWIISVPGERDPDQVFERLHGALSKYNGISSQWKFHIPADLKVCNQSYDPIPIAKKVAQYMADVLEEQRHKLEDNLTVNGCKCIQLTKIESDLKTKSTAYNAVKGCLLNLERKQTGSLLTRDLGDIVKSDQFVIGSEYMATLVVVIPRSSYSEWQSCYESLTEMVVPKSSEFMVRDFEYDQRKIEESKSEMSKLESDKRRQFAPLFRWLKVNFGEAFSAMVHTKALRVFVESVLRYGLPVDFQSILIQPNKKAHKRLREILNQLYGHLDSASASSIVDDDVTLAGMTSGSEYYPYVSFKLELNIMDIR
ncbi:V-type proton ATPase subunit C [Fasciolopsis buskii]|uniref:V-type proton ATPase subunit C n=1 Tax=Fasciolopsis buskii TaxID=27845 RepID=A0A8E0VL26_9TREM|nr:V-type proton ATPase subunit C [Fasciolopsis buski]